MAIAEQIYELVKSLPQEQASEVLTFVEFIRTKYLSDLQPNYTHTSLTWPELVLALSGAWQDDFPNLEDIRTNPTQDILRENL